MKIRTPQNRFDIEFEPQWKVLDIGGGHNPHPRANVVIDKYDNSNNNHRAGDIVVKKGQKFMLANGEDLPFEDNEFDYVICCHVLEHVENPQKFISEMCRVGKRGYFEVPSLIGESLVPKYSHKWVFLEIDSKIVGVHKKDSGLSETNLNFGDFFLYYLSRESIAFKLLLSSYPDILTVRQEWEEDLHIDVDPNKMELAYFKQTWTLEQILNQFPKRSLKQEVVLFLKGIFELSKNMISRIFQGQKLRATDKTIGLNKKQKTYKSNNVILNL